MNEWFGSLMHPIRLRNISKVYRLYNEPIGRLKEALLRGRRTYHEEFWAVRDISFEVGQGRTVGVIGRNGSGKSTLLQIIAGIVAPTYGDLEVTGRVSALLELGSGFDPEFTGRENVFMNGAIMGIERWELEERFAEIEEFAGIGHFIDRPVKLYSSGMFVRLAFATAINVDPDILLVDEALAVGDVVFQHRCMHKIREFQEKGKTIFFVSHDTGAVQKLCSEAILLEKGSVICRGKPDEVVREYFRIVWNAGEATGLTAAEKEAPSSMEQTHLPVELEEVKHFDHRFGSRRSEITGFALCDAQGRKGTAFQGGMRVTLNLAIRCNEDLDMPLAGFILRDLLGHELINTNTDAEGCMISRCGRGRSMWIAFSFVLPHLRAGSYSISAGIGNGTLENHSAYDWIENMVVFTVESAALCYGLLRTPMDVHYQVIGHGN